MCPYCGSNNVVAITTDDGVTEYWCQDCGAVYDDVGDEDED